MERETCTSPIQRIMFHPVLGLLSIAADGLLSIVDTSGVETARIQWTAGRGVFVTAADLSKEHAQVAVAGQRGIHLWQCFSQTRLGVLPLPQSIKRSTAITFLVAYTPSEKFLVSAHELRGEVRVWDVFRLELVHSSMTPNCPRASCATWDATGMMLLMFGTHGIAEHHIVEHHDEDDDDIEEDADAANKAALHATPASRALAASRLVRQRLLPRWTLHVESMGSRKSIKETDWTHYSEVMGQGDLFVSLHAELAHG